MLYTVQRVPPLGCSNAVIKRCRFYARCPRGTGLGSVRRIPICTASINAERFCGNNLQEALSSPPQRWHMEKVLIGSYDGYLHCFRAEDGRRIWKFPTGDDTDSSPVIVGSHVFVGCEKMDFYTALISTVVPAYGGIAQQRVFGVPRRRRRRSLYRR